MRTAGRRRAGGGIVPLLAMTLGPTFRSPLAIVSLALAVVALLPASASAHGFAGRRFFPATLAVDDPFVADELDLQGSFIEVPDDEGVETQTTALSVGLAKRITPRLGVEIAGTHLHLHPDGGPSENGFDDLEVGAKYLLAVLPEAETLFSVGLDAGVGGTGSRRVDAEPFSTLTPTVFLGTGLGWLPHSLRPLRPLAFTAALGPSVPTRGSEPVRFDWGLTLAYDLHYLQTVVEDVGIPAPFDHVIPVVELPLSSCLDRGCGGTTTGTANPGILWFSHWGQIGLEAQLPIDARTGHHAGVRLQLHFYLDDLFPGSLGRPVFP